MYFYLLRKFDLLHSQVADIEEKLDMLIKAYMQDRERYYALPQVPDTQHSINPKNPPNPPSGGAFITSGGTLKVSLNIKLKFLFIKNILFDVSQNRY